MTCSFIFIFLTIIILFFLTYYYYFKYIDYYSQIKLYSSIPDITRWYLTDKYIAKLYASHYGFSVPETYGIYQYPNQIKIDSLTSFVIKPLDLCDSDGVYLIHNRKHIKTGENFNLEKTKLELSYLRASIGTEHYMQENMYNGLVPSTGYIVEQLLIDKNNEIPCDYKCYLFGGTCYYVAITSKRSKTSKEQLFQSTWVDSDFNIISTPMIKNGYVVNHNLKKPALFDKMITLTQNIATQFKRHCRIDVYIVNDKIYLGEFTFFCGARLHTLLCNFKLGMLWKKNPDNFKIHDPFISTIIPDLSFYIKKK